ncbi:MAG: efflux RND transporter permease subunit [Pseudomonadota bacterium]
MISTLFFDNRRLLVLFLLFLAVGGGAALFTMPNEEDPRITVRVATIFTPFPGASAARVEQLVTEKIESAVKELDDVDEIRSSSTNGLSAVTVTLSDAVTDTDGPFGLVRDAIDDVRPILPDGALRPIFDDDRGGAYTVLIALTWGLENDPNLLVLRRSALELQDRLRNLPGTELVTLHGASSEEVVVSVNAATTAALGLTKSQIAAAIASADAKVSAGSFNGDRFEYNLELRGEIDTLTRLRSVPVATDDNGVVIRIGDIATLSRGLVDPAEDLAIHDGASAIVVATRLKEDLQVAAWAAQVEEALGAYREDLSYGVNAEIIFNQGEYASARFGSLINNLLLGAGIVVVVLFVTLGWRAALLVSAAIPLTGLGAIIVLNALNVSINQISVTGLVVALGLLVDAAIVMTDAVRRRLLSGAAARDAIAASVKRLFIPLLSSTLTTVLAFLPLATFPGATGEFVSGIGKSVMIALSASFLIAITVIATLAGVTLEKSLARERERRFTPFWVSGINPGPLGYFFRKSLEASVRAPVVSIACAVVIPVLGFIGVQTLPSAFFPPADRNQFNLELRLPSHVAITETAAAVERAQAYLDMVDDIASATWFVGASAPPFYYNLAQNQDGNAFFAQAMVTTQSLDLLEQTITQVNEELSAALPEAQIIAKQLSQGPPTFAPVELRIFGPDLAVLQEISEQARLVMSGVPEIMQTIASYSGGEPKLWLTVDEDLARRAGYTLTQLAALMREELDGVAGGTIVEGTEELPIRVQLDDAQRRSLDELASIDFEAPGREASLPVLAVSTLSLEPAAPVLRRFDGERVNIVSGYVRANALPDTAINKFNAAWAKSGYELPPGYRFQFGGEAEARSDSVGNLVGQIGVIVVLTIGVIVMTFNSFRLAGVVFIVAGLSAGLGLLALALFRFPFGFTAIIAIVGLIGVAINAAIIILSGLNRNPEALAGDKQAVVTEVLGASRHIWSTTFTTLGGFLPLILSDSKFWPPFAITIAGGVLLSTVISFYFVPQMFLLVRSRKNSLPEREFTAVETPT